MKNSTKGIIIISLVLFLSSCYKDSDPAISSSTGGSGGSNPTNPATCNFAPYRTGSKMTQTTNTTGATTDFEVTKDTTIGSDKFYVFVNKTSNISGLYIRVDGSGNVWQFTPDVNFNGQALPSTNFIYIKPNEPLNTEWSYPVSNGSTYVFKILEKGISKTINGVSYTNGIKVNLKVNFTVGGSSTTLSNADYLWFCGFGYYSLTQAGTEVSKVTSFTY
jgi:hypothetical protein